MSKKQKLLERFLSCPKDFTFEELVKLFRYFDFEKLEGSGSRVKFFNAQTKQVVSFHKPHPGNICKQYVLKETKKVLGL